MKVGYIYMLSIPFSDNDNVIKIGMSRQRPSNNIQRICDYPKNSKIYFTCVVPFDDVKTIEYNIIQVFKKKYIPYKGNEFFSGCERHMIIDILDVIKKHIVIPQPYSNELEMMSNIVSAPSQLNNSTQEQVDEINENNDIKMNTKDEKVYTKPCVCRRCGLTSTTRSNLLSHLRRKTPCDATNENISQADLIEEILEEKRKHNKIVQCYYCDAMFSTRQARHVHVKSCKYKYS